MCADVNLYSTGERYEGEWKDGIRHGQGRRYYADGSIYDGGWRRDKKHGKARMLLVHGMEEACPPPQVVTTLS